MSEEKNRTFIAIPIINSIKENIFKVISEFKKKESHVIKVKWVEDENLHLTVRFLGDVEHKINLEIIKDLKEIAKKYESFDMSCEIVGAFPSNVRPKVIWVGLKLDTKFLSFKKELDGLLLKLGFINEEKEFHPHITIGRVKCCMAKNPFGELFSKYEKEIFGNQKLDKIILMKSDLMPNGPVYTPIEIFYFK